MRAALPPRARLLLVLIDVGGGLAFAASERTRALARPAAARGRLSEDTLNARRVLVDAEFLRAVNAHLAWGTREAGVDVLLADDDAAAAEIIAAFARGHAAAHDALEPALPAAAPAAAAAAAAATAAAAAAPRAAAAAAAPRAAAAAAAAPRAAAAAAAVPRVAVADAAAPLSPPDVIEIIDDSDDEITHVK
jgi:hypothetical protein